MVVKCFCLGGGFVLVRFMPSKISLQTHIALLPISYTHFVELHYYHHAYNLNKCSLHSNAPLLLENTANTGALSLFLMQGMQVHDVCEWVCVVVGGQPPVTPCATVKQSPPTNPYPPHFKRLRPGLQPIKVKSPPRHLQESPAPLSLHSLRPPHFFDFLT